MNEKIKSDLKSYWKTLHHIGIQSKDKLSPVCNPDEPGTVNRLYDFGHRIGMRGVFKRLGNLNGKRVLDIGCGRGRWSNEFARRGAEVVGIDWSQEAIHINRQQIPECTFKCLSILELDHLEHSSFDIVNSVTVIQHVRRDFHQKIFTDIHNLLANNGKLSMLESIYNPFSKDISGYTDASYTFYWTKDAWVELVEKTGLKLTSLKGCLNIPLLRLYNKLIVASAKKAVVNAPLGKKKLSVLKESLTLFSFPIELFSNILPDRFATHGVFIFKKKE